MASPLDRSLAFVEEKPRMLLRQSPPLADAYYNQSLTMFGQGWDDRRYRFNKEGRLVPSWVDSCKE